MKLPEEYYPTPSGLAEKLIFKVDWDYVTSVLEPSAGDGVLVEAVARKLTAYSKRIDFSNHNIDAIEQDAELQSILKGKGIRVVFDDFLRYHTYKNYDLIIMNPPFSNGDKHLLKALEIQKYGGQIVCILNAETLKNAYSNVRKDLKQKLEKYEADVEFIEGAFKESDRKTDVEIAVIYVKIPVNYDDCHILNDMENAAEHTKEISQEETQLSDQVHQFLDAIVLQYQSESAAGVQIIREFQSFHKKNYSTFSGFGHEIIKLEIKSRSNESDYDINKYLNAVRYKYWETLFGRKELVNLMTEKMRRNYMSKLDELSNYEFNIRNIKQLQLELSQNNIEGVESTILDLFDSFAINHSWHPESKNNIHYYDGWATNKIGIINKKVIIPLKAFDEWRGDYSYYPNNTIGRLSDIEKVFNYLDGGITPDVKSITDILKKSKEINQTRNIEFKYFWVSFYKKGTTHIEFKNLDLLKRFNIFVGRKRNGLPPSYGKKSYNDMSGREKEVIDNFEGKDSYEKIYQNKDRFIFEITNIPLLESARGITQDVIC